MLLLSFGVNSCSSKSAINTLETIVALHQVSGTVDSAGQPVVGAALQLYAVAASGQPATMLAPAATSDSNGGFTFAAGYRCAPGSELYVTSTGGAFGGVQHASAVFSARVGTCDAQTSFAAIQIDEQTTSAAR